VSTRWWRALALGGFATVVGSVLLVTAGARAAPAGQDGPLLPVHDAALPRLLLVGDSQAVTLAQGARELLADDVNFGQFVSVGCGVGPGLATTNGHRTENDLSGDPCDRAVDRFVAAAGEAHPDLLLLHVGAWDIFDRSLDGEVIPFGTRAWDTVTSENLRRVLERLSAETDRLVVLAAPCYPHAGRAGADVFGQVALDEGAVRTDTRRVRRWNELLRTEAAELGVEVVPYDELFCDADEAGDPERPDGVHVSEDGAATAWRWILPRLGITPAGTAAP
jgi:lysophospholipase L1-like esterase